ncbi:putative nuclear protein [Sclerotinia borealis F-4128]|uniref:Putative nuclear protein n=1 Tax=Sclerotinia borealis (strain F-4128) TaxID=1432307 RepID=W9CE72_SCLBF|nr:putative nuclear protein [Sclerotinia borealis F-4128]
MSSSFDSSSSTFDLSRRRSLLSDSPITGEAVRRSARRGGITGQTSGLAPSYLQANLIVLPSRYADDFTRFCKRNPVPCPLIAKSATVGSYDALESWIEGVADEELAAEIDIRTDAPKYMVYKDAELVGDHIDDIKTHWTEDHVAFLIGCSYSFEDALKTGGLIPRHTKQSRNVPMYKTNLSLCPAGVFDQGTYVVSMRPYKKDQIERVREITRPYLATHGEPIAWGWEAVERLGIKDITKPDWGDSSVNDDGDPLVFVKGRENKFVPVFWGCGVTPQHAVVSAGLKGVVMGHAPGHMLVLDCRDDDLVKNRFDREVFATKKEALMTVVKTQGMSMEEFKKNLRTVKDA